MLQALTLDEFKLHARQAVRVAVFKQIDAGDLTPVRIYQVLSRVYQEDGVIFECAPEPGRAGYSCICFKPVAGTEFNNAEGSQPISALRKLQAQMACATRAEAADSITSAAGFIAYDAVRCFEDIPDRHPDDGSSAALSFNFYQLSLTLDHTQRTLLISTLVEAGNRPEQAYYEAQLTIAEIAGLLADPIPEDHPAAPSRVASAIETDVEDPDFMRMVDKAKDYIVRGDAFQIVISRCFKRNYSASPLAIYKTLCRISPTAFTFYFPSGAGVVIGASPERLIRVHNGQITVNPIAGTRKRNGEKSDQAISDELLHDKKELAEHMMLVDLARNDVGAVSDPGSVQVNELLKVKHYSHVSHITSSVSGRIQDKYDALDALVAAFPAGTLSGAPKIRAMQIIDELEASRRGMYGGAICRLDAAGNLDSCIAIRMAVLRNGIATVRAGAGIVFDSNPAAEAQETRQKAGSVLDAIARAHGERYVTDYR
jgi:anthranilate synthase component I